MGLVPRHPHYRGIRGLAGTTPGRSTRSLSCHLSQSNSTPEKLDSLDLLSLLELPDEGPSAEMLGRVLLRAGLGSYEQRSDRTRDLDARVNHNAAVKQRVREFHRRIPGTRSEP